MLEPKRVEMNVQPNTIEKLGNGTYYYNYDITSKEVDVTDHCLASKLSAFFIIIYLIIPALYFILCTNASSISILSAI